MAVDDLRYEIKTVQVIRGMEARTKVKWEKDGWELVEQADSAMLRTKLTFRRPKKSIRGPVLIASGAVAAGILGLIILGAVTGSHRQPASSESSLTAAVAAPTTEPAGAPTPEMTPTVVETPEATSADGAQLEQAIKDAFGVKDFTEIHVQDPSVWAGYIAAVRDDGLGNAFITLQVASDDPNRGALGQKAAQALSTLLPGAAVKGIRWLIVEDASHVVIAQKQPAPLD
jgi:hypothetical protein